MVSFNGSGIIGIAEQSDNLRVSLRGATASAHDLLDDAMRAASGWTAIGDYARFLTLQHRARVSVEKWLTQHAPRDLQPPAQSPLIEADLAALGHTPHHFAHRFTLAPSADTPSHALGVAWVLAGSALGNRAILKEVERISASDPSQEWPCAFLGDEGMLTFWKGLRQRIERPASTEEVEAASHAATAVFDHFLKTTALESIAA